MKTRLLVSVLIVSGIFQARLTAAQIIVVGEDRRASASAFVSSGKDFDQEQHSEVAPDAGPFDVSLFADAAITDATASASANQISVIATSFVRAEGTATGVAEVFVEDATAYGASQSNVAIRFVLAQPAAFSLVGFIEGEANATITVQLSRPFETVAWYSATDERIDLNQDGALEADTYDLNVTCTAVAAVFSPGAAQQGTGRYDVLMALGQSTDAPVLAAPSVRAFPNPFRESTRLTIPDGTREVRIVDARGRLVRTLSASSSVLFDGRDAGGRPLASGVYWVTLIGAEDPQAVKLVRLR
jgi:hypothetical protein